MAREGHDGEEVDLEDCLHCGSVGLPHHGPLGPARVQHLRNKKQHVESGIRVEPRLSWTSYVVSTYQHVDATECFQHGFDRLRMVGLIRDVEGEHQGLVRPEQAILDAVQLADTARRQDLATQRACMSQSVVD